MPTVFRPARQFLLSLFHSSLRTRKFATLASALLIFCAATLLSLPQPADASSAAEEGSTIPPFYGTIPGLSPTSLQETPLFAHALDDAGDLAAIDGIEFSQSSGAVIGNGSEIELSAAYGGSSAVNIDLSDLLTSHGQENIHVHVEFLDDGAPAKTALIEIQGRTQEGLDSRFYVGVNYDGGLRDGAEPNQTQICIGNSVGKLVEEFNRQRRCLKNTGLNRLPRQGEWIPIDIYVTEVGAYAVVDGIPSASFGRNQNDSSHNLQVNGLLTDLRRADDVIIYNSADFAQLPDCGSASPDRCGVSSWRNLSINKLELRGAVHDWLIDTALYYAQQYPDLVSDYLGPYEPGLAYRMIAEELMIRAFLYQQTALENDLHYVRYVISDVLPTPEEYGDDLLADISTGSTLRKLRVGQSVFSFGMAYLIAEDVLSDFERQKLLKIVEIGVQRLMDDVTFAGDTRPCAVAHGDQRYINSNMEEDKWKASGLSVGLALPLSSDFPYSRSEIEQQLWDCLQDSFANSADPEERPQSPGWNALNDGTGTEDQMANHGYLNNPDYSICSSNGNLMRVNAVLRLAAQRGYQPEPERDMLRAADVTRLWRWSQREIGLSNSQEISYQNAQDFLFSPYIRTAQNSSYAQQRPQQFGGPGIPWEFGFDDWGATARWCTSGILMSEVAAAATGEEPLGDFNRVVRLNAYLQEHTLTYPRGCYRAADESAGGYKCHYTLIGVDEEAGHRALDIQRAHRDIVSYIYLYGTADFSDANSVLLPLVASTERAP